MKKKLKIEDYLKRARKEGFAIGQFNFSNSDQLKGIVEAAFELKSPLIVGTSPGEVNYLSLEVAANLVAAWKVKLTKKLGKPFPLFLNLDHAKDLKVIKEAVFRGYDMIHFDGSFLSLKKNLQETKKVLRITSQRSVLVEAEVGQLGTESSTIYKEKFVIQDSFLTKPEDVEYFVKESGVQLLAVNIGNFHGVQKTGKNPHLRIELLREILRKNPNVYFVLHGGSGIPFQDVKKAIKEGMVKVNFNTDLRLAFAKALLKELQEKPEEIAPYKYLNQGVLAIKKVVKERIKLLGSLGKIV
jgi:ketose-bisphosphate aldolase